MTEPGSFKKSPTEHFNTAHLQKGLRRRTVRSGAASAIGLVVRTVVQFIGAGVMARLVPPDQQGIVAAGALFVGQIQILRDGGLGLATVFKKELTQDQVSNLFWLNIVIGIAAGVLVVAISPLIGWAFASQAGWWELTSATMLMAVPIAIQGLGVQHTALLRRQMKIKVLEICTGIATVVGVVAGVIAAYMGAGFYSLVILGIGQTIAVTVLVWIACDWRPGRYKRGSGVRSMLAFGGMAVTNNSIGHWNRSADNLIILAVWGTDAVAFYVKAYRLMMMQVQQLAMPINNIVVLVLTRLRDEPDRYRRVFRQFASLLAMIVMPISTFTFVAADDMVRLWLGPDWTDVGLILMALYPATMIGATNNIGWVVMSTGKLKEAFRWMLIGVPVNILGYFVGVQWGPVGVATAYSVTQLLLRGPNMLYIIRGTPVGLRDVTAPAVLPLATSLCAGAATMAVTWQWFVDEPALLRLVIAAGLFGVSHLLCWLVFPGGLNTIRERLELIKDLLPARFGGTGGSPKGAVSDG